MLSLAVSAGQEATAMPLLQIILMILGGVAGTLWVLSLFRSAATFFPIAATATDLAEAEPFVQPLVTSPWLLIWILGLAVGIWLAPKAWGQKHFTVAMRGAPRVLRLAMWITWVGAIIGSFVVGAFSGTYPRVYVLDAAFFSYACCVFISGGRLGLGEPRCTNGHVIAADMTECSLCGAPARGLAR